MTHWTCKRKLSLVIHGLFVSVPFVLSTLSAVLFWQAMFDSWALAAAMVSVLDILALTGLVLFIARIPSPFASMRHLLPFISIIPLGRELYLLLAHNDLWLAWTLTALTTGVFVVVAWQCFRTIEALWIDPVTAARERAREQVAGLDIALTQLDAMGAAADSFAWRRLSAIVQVMPADDNEAASIVSADDVMATAATVAEKPKLSRRQAQLIAAKLGVSERTVWRRLDAGMLTADDLREE